MLGDRQRGTGTKRALQAKETRVNLRLNPDLVTDSFLLGVRPGQRSKLVREALKLYIERELNFGKTGGAVFETVVVPVKPVPAERPKQVVVPAPASAKSDETGPVQAAGDLLFSDKSDIKPRRSGLAQAGHDWT